MSTPLDDLQLWKMSDDLLAETLASAEIQEKNARNRVFECRFHQAIRRNMKKQDIQNRIEELEREANALRALV